MLAFFKDFLNFLSILFAVGVTVWISIGFAIVVFYTWVGFGRWLFEGSF
jgi:hypothetical protein